MNELERTPQIIAVEINAIKAQTQGMVVQAAVEIGKRLHEVKALLPHGSFGDWVEQNCSYSERTAQNLMNVCREYGSNPQALADISLTKAIAMLGLPSGEREEFMSENPVAEMSTREVEEAVKEARAEAERLQKELDGTQQEMDLLKKSSTELQDKLKAAPSPAKVEKLQKEIEKAKAEAERLQKELEAEQGKEIPVATVEVVPPDIEAELERLREHAKKVPSEEVAALRIRIKTVQDAFGEALIAFQAVTDAEYKAKYVSAMHKIIDKMNEALEEC